LLLAHAQEHGLALRQDRELAIEQRGDERAGQDHERDAGDRQREAGLGEARRAARFVDHRMRRERRGRHAGVVHSRYGKSHDDRGHYPLPDIGGAERQPQGGGRGSDRDEHGERNEQLVVAQVRRHPHRCHAGVMHRHDAQAHEQAAQGELEVRRPACADHVEADAGDGHGDEQRECREAQVEAHRHRHDEGQHGDEMHRPDAAAHGDRRDGEPAAARQALRHPHPAAEVERGVRGKACHQDRQRDEIEIVGADDGHVRRLDGLGARL
jgi:hypothetical protein